VRAAEAHGLRVGVLTKAELHQTTTRWAQGGVAAVLGGDPDSTDLHLADTLAAGAGLCDVDAVRALVDEGPARVNELIALGAAFDREPNGDLALAREGGHSHARVVHAGGAATGAEVERALVAAVQRTAAALYEGWFAADLLVEHGRCVGVLALPPRSVFDLPEGSGRSKTERGGPVEIRARHVLLATGGAGQLFAVTTNPAEATGDGIAMALRAGAAVADLEFVQFHPTALHHPARPRPLLSEALRGHGALLRDAAGERFVDELLSRDKVSRAIMARLHEQGTDHAWLDATGLERFAERFPTIAAAVAEVGLDPAVDWLPVAPAAHYTCGGIVADLDGATSLPGLWVAGEAAGNGVHGANRLASNSLLDGMVFGPRVVEAVERGKDGPEPTGVMRVLLHGASEGAGAGDGRGSEGGVGAVDLGFDLDLGPGAPAGATGAGGASGQDDPAEARAALQRAMTSHAGVLRSAESLAAAGSAAGAAAAIAGPAPAGAAAGAAGADDIARRELANLAMVGRALSVAALAREETRGAHARTDHPDISPALRLRFVICH
jgi:L-aspartate oxidase